jgi:hypothetical protein
MLPVRNMLIDQQEPYTKPSALNISFLLCEEEDQSSYSAIDHEEAYVHMIWSRHQRRYSLHSYTKTRLSPPFHLLNKSQQKPSRQHQIESKKIEQELLSGRRQSCSSSSSSCSSKKEEDDEEDLPQLKAKRKRASSKQLEVLNKVFDRTFFPSTQLRAELGRQLGMSPRTVQIWFQNKRQAFRTKEQSVSSRENSISLE